MEEKTNYNRRQFLGRVGAMIGVGLAIPVISAINSCEVDEGHVPLPPPSVVNVDISLYPALLTAGGTAKVLIPKKNNNHPVVITRIDTSTFEVLNSVCTHEGCELSLPPAGSDLLNCPCHFVKFSRVDGSVQSGLAGWTPVPLPSYTNTFNSAANVLTITI